LLSFGCIQRPSLVSSRRPEPATNRAFVAVKQHRRSTSLRFVILPNRTPTFSGYLSQLVRAAAPSQCLGQEELTRSVIGCTHIHLVPVIRRNVSMRVPDLARQIAEARRTGQTCRWVNSSRVAGSSRGPVRASRLRSRIGRAGDHCCASVRSTTGGSGLSSAAGRATRRTHGGLVAE
jgi:hypothetical protein